MSQQSLDRTSQEGLGDVFPEKHGEGLEFGQLKLRTLLIIVWVIAANLAVFQQFSAIFGFASTFFSLAVAFHVMASHFGRLAMLIGNGISQLEQESALHQSRSHSEPLKAAQQPRDNPASCSASAHADAHRRRRPVGASACACDAIAQGESSEASQPSLLGARASYYASGSLGIVIGPWLSIDLMSRIDADIAHPLAMLAICVAGALLGVATCLVAATAVRLMSAAIQWIG